METNTTKSEILNEIMSLTERLEALKSALAILNEFEAKIAKNHSVTIKTGSHASLFDNSETSKRTVQNKSDYVIEILKEAGQPLTASEVRKLYAVKVNRNEDLVQQFVDSTLYKFNKDKKEIERIVNPTGKGFLYKIMIKST